MSVATVVLEYAKELMNRKDPMTGESKEDDYHIGEILDELGYRILREETEAMSRKYEEDNKLHFPS